MAFGPGGADEYWTAHTIYQYKGFDDFSREYWREDSFIWSWIPTYTQTYIHCGPYISSRLVTVNNNIDLSPGNVGLVPNGYDPQNTDPGHTVSVSLGVSTGDVNFNYGWSWEQPAVQYTVYADPINSYVHTLETFTGPDYGCYPFYAGPTSVSYDGYGAQYSSLHKTVEGNGLSTSYFTSKWVLNDDGFMIDPEYFFLLDIFRNQYSYELSWQPGSFSSGWT